MAKGNPQRVKVEPGIYKRADAATGRDVFEISWRDAQGKQRRRRVDGGITAARKALTDARAARNKREQITADPRLTFGAAADKWWDARVTRLRPATQTTYAGALAHLRPVFGRTRLTDIKPSDVAAYIAAKQTELKDWTVQGHLTPLSSVYQYATRHLGFAGSNPVSLLDRVERPNPAEDERPKRILEGDELPRLIGSVDEPYRLVFEFAAETGARLGEVLGIIWREVDIDESSVTFTHQLDRHTRQRVQLKTKRSRRTIEISPTLAAKLRKAKLEAPRSAPHDFVFVSRAGTPHDRRNLAGRVMKRAVKRAGLDAANHPNGGEHRAPTFHDLRHTHASMLIKDGWDIATVSARLGHANVSTTMRIYVHEFEKAQRRDERRNRLAQLYPGADAPTGAEVVPIAAAADSGQTT
jgi:integrase